MLGMFLIASEAIDKAAREKPAETLIEEVLNPLGIDWSILKAIFWRASSSSASDAGISRDLSSRAQKMISAIPDTVVIFG